MNTRKSFVTGFWQVLLVCLCFSHFWFCLDTDAGQVVITPDRVEAALFQVDNALCYGEFSHTHINLGNNSETGREGANLHYCTVGGGDYNTASANGATVGGGRFNVASGENSTVCGGARNTAGADYSWAGGLYMQLTDAALHTFVWGFSPGQAQTINTPDAFLIFPAGSPGRVGIGTTDPLEKLHIRERSVTYGAAVLLDSTGGIDGRQYYIGSTLAGNIGGAGLFQIYDDTANQPRLNITAGGRVGIGTTTPAEKLDVNGNIRCVSLTQTSDSRFKKDVRPLTAALEGISQLNSVTYHWRLDEFPAMGFDDKKQIGLVAQDVERVLPELVSESKDGYKAVSYTKLTAVLVEAVKELKTENQKQRDSLAKQQVEIEKLRVMINELKR